MLTTHGSMAPSKTGATSATTLMYEETAAAVTDRKQCNIISRHVQDLWKSLTRLIKTRSKILKLFISLHITKLPVSILDGRAVRLDINTYFDQTKRLRNRVLQKKKKYSTSDLPVLTPEDDLLTYTDDITKKKKNQIRGKIQDIHGKKNSTCLRKNIQFWDID